MTSDPPPSSSDGQSLPPRHRPSLDKLNVDTTEMDLWAFEDDLDLGEGPSKPGPGPSHRGAADIPAPREQRVSKPREPSNPLEGNSPPKGGEKIQMNVNKSRLRSQPSATPLGLSQPESEFDDLEHWDEVPKGPQIDDLPPLSAREPVVETPSSLPVTPEEPAQEMPALEPVSQSAQPDEPDDDEFSPVKRGDAKPLPLHPYLRLSKVERIGLIVLLALLTAGGLATVVYSLKRLPTESAGERINDFPIKGSMVEVASAESYWRAPITDGASPEIVRRGTALIPVLELRISGGTGAIRVLFRDENRTVVGDAVTRAVRGAGELVIPATAGFDDFGMHAAYRTGGSKPWTIEVYEAAAETAPGEDFKRLFEMNISTDRR